MALAAAVSLVVTDNQIVITDDTVYGGSNSSRNQVTVDFSVVRVLSSGTVSVSVPTYDNTTVTSVTLTGLVDGHYVVTMTIDDIPTGDSPSATADGAVYYVLSECLNTKRDEWGCECCESAQASTLKLYKLDAVISAIEYAVSVSDYSSAQCIIERAQPLCEDDSC